MTSLLSSEKLTFECVEKAKDYIDVAKSRNLPGVTYHRAALEDFIPNRRFHHLLMTNLIHELASPDGMLEKAAQWLLPGGKLHITSPNPDSVHRKSGVAGRHAYGRHPKSSERGQRFLTLRLYHNHEVAEMAGRAGLREVHRDGIFFKPLANAQMEKLEEKVLEAFDELAHEFVESSAMTYFVFEKEK